MQKVQGLPHQIALPPPYDKIPPAFQTNVAISDIRDDSQKEAEYRENFADYLVFRFEKFNDPGDVDEGGNRRKPNWEKATRFRVEMSNEAAAGEIFRLKNKHRQLWEKKHALEPAQRLHLDQTLQLLQKVQPQEQRPRLRRTVKEEARENNASGSSYRLLPFISDFFDPK
ncbi:hypothetical protein HYQ44_008071 [Verticillium longisporum]|nr:hypothetical protein HYQ44_008071 [Verticillium longisporum]